MTRTFLLTVTLGILLANPLGAQEPAAGLGEFLAQRIRLERGQLAALDRGEPVVKVLDTPDQREVALFGTVRIDVPRLEYARQLADSSALLRAPTRPHVGIFHDPATPADVAGVHLLPKEGEELRTCHPGDCKMKLPATDMRRLQTEINWSAPDVAAQLDAYARRRLVEYVTGYRSRGDSALVVYDDHGGVHTSDVLSGLLANSPYVYQEFPSLEGYLSGYPGAPLDGAREVIFWAVDSTADLRPILSVNHLVLYQPPENPHATVMATKQIYANHYFEGAFDLTVLLDREPGAPGPGMYLLVLRRFRVDHLPGGPIDVRGKLVSGLRSQLRAELSARKAVAEGKSGETR